MDKVKNISVLFLACSDRRPDTLTPAHAGVATSALRKRGRKPATLEESELPESSAAGPENKMILQEQSKRLTDALGELPVEQREVVVLKVKGSFKFRQIAELQSTSVNTVQGRYRYGIDKLRSILSSEMEK